MSELAETTQFLATREPWSLLPPSKVASYAKRAVGSYVRRGTVILSVGSSPSQMHMVRSGVVEVLDADGKLIDHDEPGACFGQSSIIEERPARFTFRAIEDTLLWSFDAQIVKELVAVPEIRRFFTEARLRDATKQIPEGGPVLQVPVADMITRVPIVIESDATVGDAARRMDDKRISAIIVTRPEGGLAGILTDRDLRRVVARGLPGDTPLTEVMSSRPFTISSDALALDALLMLVEHTIHHLPVMEGEKVLGMITSGDLMRLERSSPLYLAGDIARQQDVTALASVMTRVPQLVNRLLRQDASAADITRIISRTSDALWHRLAELAEEQLGPPPVPYCWVALGSLARQEQTMGSDQDHALIVSDEATIEHQAYFAELAEFLTSGLAACGMPRCDGDVMATNPRWRKPRAAWVAEFNAWMGAPTSENILNSSIFFDMRAVHGDETLYATLQRRILSQAPSSTLFLGHLAKNANNFEVPIGFLRGLVVEKQGEHRDRLDIKRGGINPIVDVARVYALRWGLPQVSTRARLLAAAEHGAEVDNLLDAFELLSYTRLRHQGKLVTAGQEPDNFVNPHDLSELERRHLRDAFRIVARAQQALTVVFQTQYMS